MRPEYATDEQAKPQRFPGEPAFKYEPASYKIDLDAMNKKRHAHAGGRQHRSNRKRNFLVCAAAPQEHEARAEAELSAALAQSPTPATAPVGDTRLRVAARTNGSGAHAEAAGAANSSSKAQRKRRELSALYGMSSTNVLELSPMCNDLVNEAGFYELAQRGLGQFRSERLSRGVDAMNESARASGRASNRARRRSST